MVENALVYARGSGTGGAGGDRPSAFPPSRCDGTLPAAGPSPASGGGATGWPGRRPGQPGNLLLEFDDTRLEPLLFGLCADGDLLHRVEFIPGHEIPVRQDHIDAMTDQVLDLAPHPGEGFERATGNPRGVVKYPVTTLHIGPPCGARDEPAEAVCRDLGNGVAYLYLEAGTGETYKGRAPGAIPKPAANREGDMLTLTYPVIDPVIVEVGPFAIRWYALSYVVGILLAWRYMVWLARRRPGDPSPAAIDDFVIWATIGVVVGGRLGYVLFYKPGYYLDHPLAAFALWQGGMSFHGGLVGVIAALWLFARRRRFDWIALGDITVCGVPIGLFLGRLANFVNGELYGRVTDSPLGMVFPQAGPLPRHPSQIYEAFLEGLVLFAVLLWCAVRTRSLSVRGRLSGIFLIGYGIARIIAEFFRQPDAHLGFLVAGTTMGQWLCVPLVFAGLWLLSLSRRHDAA